MPLSSSQPFTVVVFGATGTAGAGVIRACLEDERVTEIRAVTRRALSIAHPKLREVPCVDFADLAPIADAMRAVDACLFCLGTSVRNVATEAEYREIHVHYALAAARTLLAHSPRATFVYLSGAGTNRRSRMMWARVKAEAEDELASLGLARLVCVRPGGIPPAQPSGFDRWIVAPLLKALPSLGIEADALGRAMLAAVCDLQGSDRVVLENRALKALAATPRAASKAASAPTV
jgi:nucleoside-diphosphate-sugar epimerase